MTTPGEPKHAGEPRALRNDGYAHEPGRRVRPDRVLVAIGFVATATDGAYIIGPVTAADAPIIAPLALAVTARTTTDPGRRPWRC